MLRSAFSIAALVLGLLLTPALGVAQTTRITGGFVAAGGTTGATNSWLLGDLGGQAGEAHSGLYHLTSGVLDVVLGPVVPVFLSDFDVSQSDWNVAVRWRVAAPATPTEFRLTAGEGPTERDIRVEETTDALTFEALDTSPQTNRSGEVTYRLLHREEGGEWILLGERMIVLRLQTRLLPPAPNPFRPGGKIRLSLRQPQNVRVSIHDVAGREVVCLVQRSLGQGYTEIGWNGRDNAGQRVAAGMYFIRFACSESVQTRKLVVIR